MDEICHLVLVILLAVGTIDSDVPQLMHAYSEYIYLFFFIFRLGKVSVLTVSVIDC